MSDSRSRFCSTRSSRRWRFDLLRLEAADAGRLFEDGPAVLGRGLQQPIDLALLDQAVGIARRRRCRGTGRECLSAGHGWRLMRYSPSPLR